jgi:hypothetical protein
MATLTTLTSSCTTPNPRLVAARVSPRRRLFVEGMDMTVGGKIFNPS